MILNSIIVERGLQAAFEAAYKETQTRQDLVDLMACMTVIRSTSSRETMGWFGDFPIVKEWVGDRNISSLKDYKYTIVNKSWLSGFPINKDDMDDDQIGAVMPRAAMLGQVLAQFPLELVANFLVNGTANLAFDNVAFFSNASGERVNDNLLAGTGTTLAQIKTDLATARATMKRFVGDKGKVLGLNMDTIICAPELEPTMLEAITSASFVTTGQGGTANPLSNWIKRVISLPELTDTNDWYGLCTSYPIRPFIFQERQAVETSMDDTDVKKNKTIVFQADMRGNAGYGLPQMALKVVNS